MVELALHLASGPGPQSTDAPRARGDEPQANESRCRVSLSAASHDGEGGTLTKLHQLFARLRATLKL